MFLFFFCKSVMWVGVSGLWLRTETASGSWDFRKNQHCQLSWFLSQVAGFKASAADIMVLPNFSFKAEEFSGYYCPTRNPPKYTRRKMKKKSMGLFWDTGIFYKVSHIFEAWLMMSTTWSRQYWERKWLCFTQESVSFLMTNREEIGKDKASGGTSKPQNHLKCSERRLRNKVDDLAQSFMRYKYFNRFFFFF